MFNYYEPEPRVEPPEALTVGVACGHEIYEGEADDYVFYYQDKDEEPQYICSVCFEDALRSLINSRLSDNTPIGLIEIADMMGIEYKRVFNDR